MFIPLTTRNDACIFIETCCQTCWWMNPGFLPKLLAHSRPLQFINLKYWLLLQRLNVWSNCDATVQLLYSILFNNFLKSTTPPPPQVHKTPAFCRAFDNFFKPFYSYEHVTDDI
jgi:hypothetical protein